MKLIYRGQTFTTDARPMMPYRQPYAINWRYQVDPERRFLSEAEGSRRVDGEQYSYDLPKMNYRQPKAINWRWQNPTEYSHL